MPQAQEKDTTSQAQSKKERAQLHYIQLDCDFFTKPKIIAVQYKFGAGGLLAVIDCLCKMGKGTDAEIPLDCALAIAESYEVSDPEAFVKYCLSLRIFNRGSSDLFLSNDRMVADQENVAGKQKKWRDLKRQQRESIRTNEGQKEESDRTLNIEDLKTEDLKDLKKLSTITPEAFDAVKRWAVQRRKLRLAFDEMAAEALQMQYAGRSEDLIRDVSASIAANARNIFVAPLPQTEQIALKTKAKGSAPPGKVENTYGRPVRGFEMAKN